MSSNEFNKLDREYTEREDYLASRAEERGAPIRAYDKSDNETPPQTAFMVERLRYISETDDARFGGIRETLFDAIRLLEQMERERNGAQSAFDEALRVKNEYRVRAEEVKLRIAEDV